MTTINPQLVKLRASHIPPYVFTTNFTEHGLLTLKDRVTSAAVLDAAIPVNIYVYSNADRASLRRVCLGVGLLAKAMCLQGREILHINLAGMLREQRFNEMEREARTLNPVMSRIGKGYIAISDFLDAPDVEQKYGYHAMQLVADYLISHVERGGGLILGGGATEPRDVHQLGSAFGSLMGTFESYKV